MANKGNQSIPHDFETCQLCDQHGHTAINCPWMYSKCPVRDCPGIKMLLQSESNISKGKKFLKCQFPTCGGVKWLNEAISQSKGDSNISFKCYTCGDDDHISVECPWDGFPCLKPNCDGYKFVGTSKTSQNPGKKYIKCESCNDFEWLINAIAKQEAMSKQEMFLKGKSSPIPIDELCRNYKIKSKISGCYHCGNPNHHGSACLLQSIPCRKDGCKGIMKLKTSKRDYSLGKKFMICELCSEFKWL